MTTHYHTQVAQLQLKVEANKAQAKDLVLKNLLLTTTLNDVRAKAQRLLVENFYVATRSAGIKPDAVLNITSLTVIVISMFSTS